MLNAELTAIGLTKTRAETLLGMARAVDSGAVRLDPAQPLEETVGQLTELRGIGDWTAHYIAMRGLGQGDAFPASDLILRRAASTGPEPLSTKLMIESAERWRPFRAYAAIALWSSYAGHTKTG